MENDFEKLKELLLQECVYMWTSPQFNYPPYSRLEAKTKSIEVGVFFDSSVKKLQEQNNAND